MSQYGQEQPQAELGGCYVCAWYNLILIGIASGSAYTSMVSLLCELECEFVDCQFERNLYHSTCICSNHLDPYVSAIKYKSDIKQGYLTYMKDLRKVIHKITKHTDLCCFKQVLLRKPLPHVRHLCGRSFVCVSSWLRSLSFTMNPAPHVEQE